MYDNCPTCELLWQEFSEATKAHAAILAKSELSETEQNSDIVKELELVKLATAERHAKARMALREHVAANQHEKATSQKSHGVHQKTPTETDGELSVPSASASVRA